jgi:hypothetical protein
MRITLHSGRICLTLIAGLTIVSRVPAAEITLHSLLGEMTDFAAVARWPQPAFICRQASSYDRADLGRRSGNRRFQKP